MAKNEIPDLDKGLRLPAFLEERAPKQLQREQAKVYAPSEQGYKLVSGAPTDLDYHDEAKTAIDLQKLEEHFIKKPLDVISIEINALTYGEMFELAEAFVQADKDGVLTPTINANEIAKIMHRWAVSRLKKGVKDEQHPNQG